jgi:hypothetical protein
MALAAPAGDGKKDGGFRLPTVPGQRAAVQLPAPALVRLVGALALLSSSDSPLGGLPRTARKAKPHSPAAATHTAELPSKLDREIVIESGEKKIPKI